MPRKTTSTSKKTVKSAPAKKAAPRRVAAKTAVKKSPAKKSIAQSPNRKPNKKIEITYWESVQQGHAATFDDHPNLKILLLVLIVSFVIFLMMEIPVIYASSIFTR